MYKHKQTPKLDSLLKRNKIFFCFSFVLCKGRRQKRKKMVVIDGAQHKVDWQFGSKYHFFCLSPAWYGKICSKKTFFQIIPSKLLSVCTEFDNLSLKTSRNYFFFVLCVFLDVLVASWSIRSKKQKVVVFYQKLWPGPRPFQTPIPFVVPTTQNYQFFLDVAPKELSKSISLIYPNQCIHPHPLPCPPSKQQLKPISSYIEISITILYAPHPAPFPTPLFILVRYKYYAILKWNFKTKNKHALLTYVYE